MNFFRSEDHLRAWYGEQGEMPGAAAVLAEAFTLGAEIFGGLWPERRR